MRAENWEMQQNEILIPLSTGQYNNDVGRRSIGELN